MRTNATTTADTILANRLAALRRAAGLTQQQLADRVGMPVYSLRNLEQGQRSISGAAAGTVLAIAQALDTTVEALISMPD